MHTTDHAASYHFFCLVSATTSSLDSEANYGRHRAPPKSGGLLLASAFLPTSTHRNGGGGCSLDLLEEDHSALLAWFPGGASQ